MACLKILRITFIVALIISPLAIHAQDSQLNPVSTWLFNPSYYNPAISGSLDYSPLYFISASGKDYNSLTVSGSTRLARKVTGYYNMPDHFTYRNTGAGLHLFNINAGGLSSLGLKVTGSYHFKLDESSLSFLSLGISLKGSRNTMDITSGIEPPLAITQETSFDSNIDLGLYYYGPAFYAGISSSNILPADSASYAPSSRHYHFTGGYKLMVYRPLSIMIEPSLILSATDTSTIANIHNIIYPVLKIYIENFCLGTYFYKRDRVSLFFRYNYPGMYVGAFLSLSGNSAFYKNEPSIEFSAGINLSYNKARRYKRFHW